MQHSASSGWARAWASSSARTLARRLRRERRQELGFSRSQALAFRTSALRMAVAAHWELQDALGCSFGTFGEALVAARLVSCSGVQEKERILSTGNWARRAPPPGAPPSPPVVPRVSSESRALEAFRQELYAQPEPELAAEEVEAKASFGSADCRFAAAVEVYVAAELRAVADLGGGVQCLSEPIGGPRSPCRSATGAAATSSSRIPGRRHRLRAARRRRAAEAQRARWRAEADWGADDSDDDSHESGDSDRGTRRARLLALLGGGPPSLDATGAMALTRHFMHSRSW